MEKIEDIKARVSALIDEAYDSGAADKAAECQDKLDEAVKKAADRAYLLGGAAVLRELASCLSPEPEPEPQPEPKPEPMFSLENDAVAAFMTDPTYYAPGFAIGSGLSVVDKYIVDAVEGSRQCWTEQPKPIPIDFTQIFDEDGNEVPIIGGIYNLIPGRRYTYTSPEGDGAFRTEPNTVRMIRMADSDPVVNIRDIGGYPCQSGGHVAYGKVIRSSTLNKLTRASLNARILQAIGVTDVITSSSSNPARTDLGLWDGEYIAVDAYKTVIKKRNGILATFNRIFSDVESGGCVLLHCYSGTDRTGTLVSLILGLLGVSEGDIIKEWELTCFFCWFVRVRISDWEKRAAVRKECPEGQLRQFFKEMKRTYGQNGENFQQQCQTFLVKTVGLDADKVEAFKQRMITFD